MQVKIELPDIKAVSRNDTTGHYIKYYQQLTLAEQWMWTFGKRYEHHFEGQVDVIITAYYDTRGNKKCADTPNIDDKIFTDVLIRYKRQKKDKPIERGVWFIEDDNPKYLRSVTKFAIASDHFAVEIVINSVDDE